MGYDYLNFDRKDHNKRRNKLIAKILIWAVQIVFVVGLAYFIVNYTLEKTLMIDSSMSPTLAENDIIIINKLSYWFSEPERYDIVVFSQSGKEHEYYNIKRIIGLPGETVLISGGHVYINGEILKGDIEAEEMLSAGIAETEITLEENEYFVLGDSRNNSEDSRFADIGTIVKSDIIGKAWIRTSPDFAFISKLTKYKSTDEKNDTD